jgi:hypothetical protein
MKEFPTKTLSGESVNMNHHSAYCYSVQHDFLIKPCHFLFSAFHTVDNCHKSIVQWIVCHLQAQEHSPKFHQFKPHTLLLPLINLFPSHCLFTCNSLKYSVCNLQNMVTISTTVSTQNTTNFLMASIVFFTLNFGLQSYDAA